MADYKLSASLSGHEDDVRAVNFPKPDAIISASRDATVRVWSRTSSSPPKFDDTISQHGTTFINAVTYIPSHPNFPEGLIVSGGKDTLIDVRKPGQAPDSDPERLLLGHQGNVCALDVCLDGKIPYLVSGSWDASAMVWDIEKGESTATLEGHQASVWAVLAYDQDTIITGCADKQIRVFRRDGKLVRTFQGGADVVRALCRLPANSSGAHFASAGNDSIIRLWRLDGSEVAQLHGHENFVYSLAALSSGELVSSSEDRTLRVWRDNQCVQTITHPAISVWSIAVCAENGDIVSGASDKVVRVFSRSVERQADPETITAFEDSVKASSIPQQQMGEINKEKLPGPEFLQNKSGTKEGQVQMIREANGNVSAHQWSSAAQQWINIGTVVDSTGSSGRKQEYLGKEYDFVFDVDISEGKPALKLPFNLSQNPYEVAQKFIGDNELPITYLDQVANFIITNSQGATIGQQSGSSQPSGTYSDPWGQESRYRPSEQSPAAAPSRPQIIPQKGFLTIETAAFPTIRKKVEELSQQLIKTSREDIAFGSSDLEGFTNAIKDLEAALKDGKPITSPSLNTGVDLSIKMITQWPQASRTPGYDIYRLLAAATPTTVTRHDPLSIFQNAGALPTTSTVSADANANATMLAIRFLANIFTHAAGRAYALTKLPAIRESIWPCVQHFVANRNVLIAAMTVYINYGVLLASEKSKKEAAKTLIGDVVSLLAEDAIVDSEVLYRALVALGTLIVAVAGKSGLNGEEMARVKAVLGRVEGVVGSEPRIKGVLGEVRGVTG